MGWDEKKILLQVCLEFWRKDIISNICFPMYLNIRFSIKFLGISVRAWLQCGNVKSLHL